MAAPEGKFVAVTTKNRAAGVLATKNRLYRGERERERESPHAVLQQPFSSPAKGKKTKKILINLVER